MRVAEQKHHIAGKLRLQLAPGKGDQSLFESLRGSLTDAPGVRHVYVKPASAGIVIEYDPALFATFRRSLAEFAQKHDLFVLAPNGDALPPPHAFWCRRANCVAQL